MPKSLFLIVTLIIWITCISNVQGQSIYSFDEIGRFFIDTYTPSEYDATPQNWDIAQGHNGFMYFANNTGVLEYDGVSWRSIPTENHYRVRSVATGKDGKIYVGGVDEIGFLGPDSLGTLTYRSLLEELPQDERSFGDVWYIAQAHDGLYFSTTNNLFRLSDGEFATWQTESAYESISVLNDTLHVQEHGKGLMKMHRDSLVSIPGGSFLAEKNVQQLIPREDNSFLAVTLEHGVFVCDGAPSCEPFIAESRIIDLELSQNNSRLQNGTILLSTSSSGLLMVSPRGELLHILDEQNGLYDNTILGGSYVDSQGDVWLALNSGIARISTNASVSSFDKRTGLDGSISAMVRHNGQLHAATFRGVYKLVPSIDGMPANFQAIEGINTSCWSLVSVDDTLLAGCGAQLLDVYNNQTILELPDKQTAYFMMPARKDSNRVFLGLNAKFMILEHKNKTWKSSLSIDIESPIRTIAEDDKGNIWLGTEQLGPILITPPFSQGDLNIRRFAKEDGLPAGGGEVKKVADRIVFHSYIGHGIFASKQSGDSLWFEPQSIIDTNTISESTIQSLHTNEYGNIVLSASVKSAIGKRQPDSSYTFEPYPLRVANLSNTFAFFFEEDGVGWFGHGSGIIRVGNTDWAKDQAPYEVAIRRISTGDSLLFGGTQKGHQAFQIWPFGLEKVRFEFAAPRYESSNNNQYRTWLKGYDVSWSDWSNEPWVDFTQLREGEYSFHAQAKDLKGKLSREAVFVFRILPPWYRTLWAYGIWSLLALGSLVLMTVGYNKYHSQQLFLRNKILQERVAERTAELSSANNELLQVNEELMSSNRRLEERTDDLRDALEANKEILGITAHDLKNPLGGIIGLADLILDDAQDGKSSETIAENLPMLKGEAERMLQIVKDLLDSHRQGEEVPLRKDKTKLDAIVSTVIRWNGQQAQNKEITLTSGAPANVKVNVDILAIQRVLDNYVSNAIKYSPPGSKVCVQTNIEHCAGDDGETVPQVCVLVKDEGPGLTENDKSKVFGKLQRLSAKPTGGEHSTGLGLFIVKKLVEAHDGEVGVDSTYGHGASFWFRLPTD